MSMLMTEIIPVCDSPTVVTDRHTKYSDIHFSSPSSSHVLILIICRACKVVQEVVL